MSHTSRNKAERDRIAEHHNLQHLRALIQDPPRLATIDNSLVPVRRLVDCFWSSIQPLREVLWQAALKMVNSYAPYQCVGEDPRIRAVLEQIGGAHKLIIDLALRRPFGEVGKKDPFERFRGLIVDAVGVRLNMEKEGQAALERRGAGGA